MPAKRFGFAESGGFAQGGQTGLVVNHAPNFQIAFRSKVDHVPISQVHGNTLFFPA
jgi:hypothetical protein